MNYLWSIYEFIVCAIDVFLLTIFLAQIKGIKLVGKIRYSMLGGIATAFVVFILTYLDMFSFQKVMLGLIVSFIYSGIFFEGSLWKKILYVIMMYGLFGLSDLIAVTFVRAMSTESLSMVGMAQNAYRICYTVLSKAITTMLCISVLRLKITGDYILPTKYKLIFVAVFSTALSILFLLLYAGLHLDEDVAAYSIIVVLSSFLLLIYAVVIYLFYQMCTYFAESNRRSMLDYQNEMLNKYALQKETSDEAMRLLSHDLKHCLSDIWPFNTKKLSRISIKRH